MYPTSGYDNYNYICPNRGAARYTSQLLNRIKRHIDKNTLIVGDLNTPLSAIDRSSKQEISKETIALNAILDELDLIDTYRTLHPRTKEYSFYSNAHGTFSRIDHVLGHKTGLNQYQKTDHSLRILRPQCFEIGTQPQGKTWKKVKHLETKNHPAQE